MRRLRPKMTHTNNFTEKLNKVLNGLKRDSVNQGHGHVDRPCGSGWFKRPCTFRVGTIALTVIKHRQKDVDPLRKLLFHR